MSFSLNRIQLIGHLGQNAETRFTTSNKSVTSFSIATTHSHKGADGNWINDTTWHNCISWELPDFLKSALVKGAKFYVEGRLSKRDYTDKDGVKKYVTEVVTEKLIPLEKRESSQSSGESQSRTGSFENTTVEDKILQQDDLDGLPF